MKIIKLIVVMFVATSLLCLPLVARAEGAETSADDKATVDMEKIVSSAIERVKGMDEQTQAIVGVVLDIVCIGIFYLMTIPSKIKASNRIKQLQTAYTLASAEVEKERSEKAQLQSTFQTFDIEAWREPLDHLITEIMTEKIGELKITDAVYADMTSKLEMMMAQNAAIISGAERAWAGSPAAVAALSSVATEGAVYNMALKLKKYEDFIRKMKGEEAEEILADLRAGGDSE